MVCDADRQIQILFGVDGRTLELNVCYHSDVTALDTPPPRHPALETGATGCNFTRRSIYVNAQPQKCSTPQWQTEPWCPAADNPAEKMCIWQVDEHQQAVAS